MTLGVFVAFMSSCCLSCLRSMTKMSFCTCLCDLCANNWQSAPDVSVQISVGLCEDIHCRIHGLELTSVKMKVTIM